MVHQFDFGAEVLVNAPRLGLYSRGAIVKTMGINVEGQKFYQVYEMNKPAYKHIVLEEELTKYDITRGAYD